MPTPHPHPPRRQPLTRLLKAALHQARSLAVVGIGSDLRGDDIAGLLVLRELQAALPRIKERHIQAGHSDVEPTLRRLSSDQNSRYKTGSTIIGIPGHRIHPETSERIRLFDGGTAPENLTGEIVRFQPSHILLVDAADLGLKPGAATLLDPESIGGISFSTHVLPLSILANYLKSSLPCRIMILGIQPGPTAFSAKHSKAIGQSALRLARVILNAATDSVRTPDARHRTPDQRKKTNAR